MRTFVALFLCLVCLNAVARTVDFVSGGHLNWKHFGATQGLPSSETYQVFQDSKGYIWMATDRGVVRFDGQRMLTFNEENGLPDQVIFKFYEDYRGWVWFISFKGDLSYWNGKKLIVYKYNHLIRKYLKDYQATYKCLVIDRKGNLYYSLSLYGSIMITPDGRMSNYHLKKAKIQEVFIEKIDKDYFFSNLTDFYIKATKPTYVIRNGVKKKAHVLKGNMRIGVFPYNYELYGLMEFELVDLNKRIVKIVDKTMINVFVEKDHVWICSVAGGVRRYKKSNFHQNAPYVSFLKGHSVSDVCRDRNGGYWFATLDNGVYYIPSLKVHNFSVKNGLIDNVVSKITTFNNEITLGTLKGYQILNKNSEQLIPVNTYTAPNAVYSKNGVLYLSGFYHGMVKRNKRYVFLNDKPRDFDTHGYLQSETGVYKSVGNNIFYLSDNKPNSWDTLVFFPKISAGFFYSLAQDQKKNMYCGGISGVYKVIDKKPISLQSYDKRLGTRVSEMKYDSKYGLLIATRGEGLLRYQNNKIVQTWNSLSGLLDDHLTGVFVDSNHDIYVCGYNGVSRIRILPNNTSQIVHCNKLTGMISDECLSIAVNNNCVLVGTKKGVVSIETSFFDLKRKQPELKIDHVVAEGKPCMIRPSMVFKEGISSIQIKLRSLDYIVSNHARFRFRLDPKQAWSVIRMPEIDLSYPGNGNYQLEVCSLDEFGRWSQQARLLDLSISPPFYKKWYFTAFLALLSVWAVYLAFRARLKAVNKKFALQKKVYELEQKALSAQMNPHFIFNSLNSIQSFLLYDENEKAERYLLNFSKLIRSILSISRETFITLDQEIELLTNYIELEEMRFWSKFEYRIECNMIKGLDQMIIPPMMIQPIVENAILHGLSKRDTGGLLLVRFDIETDVIHVKVEDNGPGIQEKVSQESKGHRSFGTQITRERIEIYEKNFNKRFIMKVEKATNDINYPGTRVILSIPVQHKND
jgi:ligand-binding sensor domain-containing protein/two-component sensor histidine kinase